MLENAKWFAHLREDPGWKRLHDKIVEQRLEYTGFLARRLMRGEVVAPRELDTQRGFFLGALYAVRHPEQAEEGLTQAARIAWLLLQAEVENPEEEESPYA